MKIEEKEDLIQVLKNDKAVTEKWIDSCVTDIEGNTKFRLPETSKEKAYLKACWLLYIFQKVKLATGEETNENLDFNIKLVKVAMEVLR